ncbi:hypothetical protein E4U47_005173 [Claviceps purpurea]|nr:hypothetical protein E4U51_006979 [Claviceps purpurea]KAG6267654.1 hypothetical protein E4U47_005173 [Claviceps purpurea]
MTHETLAIKAAETNLEHALFVLDDPVASAAGIVFAKIGWFGTCWARSQESHLPDSEIQAAAIGVKTLEGKIHTFSRKIAASALIGNAASSAIGKSAEWWRY